MELFYVYLLLLCSPSALCWEMELYDLVEELSADFYTLLGVERTAEYRDIRRAFKQKSLVLHPDKNDSPDAHVVFRQLVAVHEVLRDAEKRRQYNHVLDNGLPDWRHAVYYYRRVRKLGLLEMVVILSVIITIGQYLVAWAAYAERKYTIDEYVETQKKRLIKKHKKGKIDELPDMTFHIPKPSVFNTLPFQVPKLIWVIVLAIPYSIRAFIKYITEKPPPVEESSEEEEEVEETWTKGPRRRRNFVIPEANDSMSPPILNKTQEEKIDQPNRVPVSGGLWTDDDFAELIRLVNKYPPGTAKRWEKVAEALGRAVPEVIHMSKKVKEGLTVKSEVPEEATVVEKVKTRGGKLGPTSEGGDKEWTSIQQKALEEALVKFPKQVAERWERIAKCVPGKTKEDCMVRYKVLAETIRKKREDEACRSDIQQ